MMGIKHVIVWVLILKLHHAQLLDGKIKDIFGELPNSSKKSCGPNKLCVPLYLCQSDRIIKHGESLIDIRFDDNKGYQKCSPLEECCSVDDVFPEHTDPSENSIDVCGYRNSKGIGFRIISSDEQETQFGEFPWMVAILKEEITESFLTSIYLCGGSIIHPSVVLTAAHCVEGAPLHDLKARAGEWDVETKTELLPDQDRQVLEVVIHERYYRGALFNDMALLYLEKPFEIAGNVKPICLPPQSKNFDFLRCLVTGWGKDTFGQTGKYQVVLKKVDLPIVPNKQCEATLRSTRLGRYFTLHSSFICAGGERGKDTCKGDGGSPLVCPIAGSVNRYYQAGIVAWGIGCGGSIPGVYVSVANLRLWIDEQLAKKDKFVENVW